MKKKKKWVALQFTDISGRLREVIVPSSQMTKENIETGFSKLDGSSIPGFMGIEESDMVLTPVMDTEKRLPWKPDTSRVLNKISYAGGSKRFEKDPRYVAEKTESVINDMGYSGFFGPEVEFFIIDGFAFHNQTPSTGLGYSLRSEENPSIGSSPAIGYKEGYYSSQPIDRTYDTRSKIVEALQDSFGFDIEASHHEVATNGQVEINFRFGRLVDTADMVQTLKYAARNIAHADGKHASFVPKPFFGDNGSGMHVNTSLSGKDGKNAFYDAEDDYAQLSQLGRYAVGGIMQHADALSAIVSPTTNSYRRLTPGFEAPVYIAWGRSNRSAIVRVPSYKKDMEKTKRIEYRAPDPSANPYLALSAIALAEIDGIRKKIDPSDPINKSIYRLSKEEIKKLGVKQLPSSLEQALDSLESDNAFLKGVFTEPLLETYIEMHRNEARELNRYPSPVEIERLDGI